MLSAIVAIWTIGDSTTPASSLLNFTTGILSAHRMAAMRCLLAIAVALSAALACAQVESRRLNEDNPVRPVAPPPYGMEERSEEHTSELQSRLHLVCRLLLEKKKKKRRISMTERV